MTENWKAIIPGFVSFTKTYHNNPYPAISPSRPELSAHGKNVVITGGGTGIGKSIAKAFALAGAASIALFARREDRLVSAIKEIKEAVAASGAKHETKFFYFIADVLKRETVDAAFASLFEQLGRQPIHIYVSNAGTLGPLTPVATTPIDEFMAPFELHIRGALNGIQAFLPYANPLENGGATLINISTGIAHFASPMPGVAAYASSKIANARMLDYISAEAGEALWVVNLQPGVVSTEINEGTDMEGQDDPDLPGHFAVWLASPEARFLRGKLVWSNWDVDELKAKAKEIESSLLLRIVLDGVVM